jgi:hypothetical protein
LLGFGARSKTSSDFISLFDVTSPNMLTCGWVLQAKALDRDGSTSSQETRGGCRRGRMNKSDCIRESRRPKLL